MIKVLLLSSIIMSIVLPIRAARVRNPGVAIRRAALTVLAFNTVWWVTVLVVFNLAASKFAPGSAAP